MHVVEAVDLTKVYHNRYIALNTLDLQVDKGMVYGLVGPNGAGKSTTFRIMLGLQRPTAGEVRVFGEPMGPQRADLRRRIGFLPTSPSLPREMTPITYLRFVGKLLGMDRAEVMIRLSTLLQVVDLASVGSQRIDELSTGMVTRLGIAAALMNDPELLIFDEPTSGLDPSGRRQTIELIRELSGHDRTIIIATHILSDVERLCTDIGIISEGRIIYHGPMAEMRRLVRQRTISVEVEGNLMHFEQQLVELDTFGMVRAERIGSEFRISFLGAEPIPAYVQRVLDLVERTGVELLHLDTGTHEIEEAFLRRLEEDRATSFIRASAWTAAQKLALPPANPRNGSAVEVISEAPPPAISEALSPADAGDIAADPDHGDLDIAPDGVDQHAYAGDDDDTEAEERDAGVHRPGTP